jgi:hypothetical protein
MRTEIFQKRTISVPNWVSVEINGIWQSQRKPSIFVFDLRPYSI